MNTLHNAEFCHKNKKIVKICLENVKGASQAMTREDGMRKRPGGVGGGGVSLPILKGGGEGDILPKCPSPPQPFFLPPLRPGV